MQITQENITDIIYSMSFAELSELKDKLKENKETEVELYRFVSRYYYYVKNEMAKLYEAKCEAEMYLNGYDKLIGELEEKREHYLKTVRDFDEMENKHKQDLAEYEALFKRKSEPSNLALALEQFVLLNQITSNILEAIKERAKKEEEVIEFLKKEIASRIDKEISTSLLNIKKVNRVTYKVNIKNEALIPEEYLKKKEVVSVDVEKIKKEFANDDRLKGAVELQENKNFINIKKLF